MPQKLRCRVTDILDHGKRVYSIFLEPETIAPRFLPGQFLHLAMDDYSPGDYWPDSRPFSIVNSPAERRLLRITFAVKGQFTTRMEAELHPGSEVWVRMPYGEFIVNNENDVCLLAGGTGITAFTAFLSGLSSKYLHHVYLFYGARSPGLLIYRPLVEAAQKRCSNLQVWFMAEKDVVENGCKLGRINVADIFTSLPDPLAVLYYLAGPPEMIDNLVTDLGQRGVPAKCLAADAWE